MLLPGALPRDFYEILFEVLEYKFDVASKVLGTLLNVTGNAQNKANHPQAGRTHTTPSFTRRAADG
jgi:hypothetical protein